MGGTSSKPKAADNADSENPNPHSNLLHERMQNLNVSGDTSDPKITQIPAENPSSHEKRHEQADGTQGEESCIIEALSNPICVGYDARNDDSSHLSIPTPAADATVINITLCRFESGRLIKELHSPSSVRFVAVSHVWGNAQWRSVDGWEGEVLISDDKAKFVTNSLPKFIGEDWFWMDVLCIDQRSKAARIAVTQHIPTIFRHAMKTLVIRTNCGYQQCCADEWHSSWKRRSRAEATGEMFKHMRDSHSDDDCDEGVLTRLWPYQEILLSNNVQFARCERIQSASAPYAKKINTFPEMAIIESLISTAIIWTSYGESDGDDYSDLYYADFIDAFFGLGTVERTNPRGIPHFPLAQEFDMIMNNKRRTTKARDFILAIMPQFSFYRVPRNAKDITFCALFFDCIRQLCAIGHVMAPLIIRRTINLIESNTCIWETEIPEPTSLGEFVKLLNGPRISFKSRSVVPLYAASVRSVSDVADMESFMGSDPDEELLNASRAMLTIHLVVRQMSLSQQLFSIANGDLMHIARAENDELLSSRECFIDAVRTLLTIAFLLEQGLDGQEIAAYNGYELITYLMSESNREAILLLAAMIACNIGLGAFDWAQGNLRPLRVDLPYPGVQHSALALVSRAHSLNRRFFLTDGGQFSFRMGGADAFKRWALFSTEHLESGDLDMCIFPLEVRFRQWDDGHEYRPGPVGIMAAIL